MDREFEIEERIFPNGRKIQAINRDYIEFENEDGDVEFTLRRLATADCGCSCLLTNLYMCNRCSQIVCHNHTSAFPCSICGLPFFCFRCLVIIDNGETQMPVCLTCASQIKRPSFISQIWKGIFSLVFKKKESHEVTRRNP